MRIAEEINYHAPLGLSSYYGHCTALSTSQDILF